MNKVLNILIIFILVGCGIFHPAKPKELDKLSNDDLCRALGTYNDDGSFVLKIYDELKIRKNVLNTQRCHALEKTHTAKTQFIGIEHEPRIRREPWTFEEMNRENSMLRDVQRILNEERD